MRGNLKGRIVRGATLVALLTTAATTLPVTQANALTSTGTCRTSQGFYANFALDFRNLKNLNGHWFHRPDRYRWGIATGAHAMGDKSNVEAFVWDATDDKDYGNWVSRDNVPVGGGQVAVPGPAINIRATHGMYARMEFTFDWVDHSDPSCAGLTQTV